jgi:hypothetical protein
LDLIDRDCPVHDADFGAILRSLRSEMNRPVEAARARHISDDNFRLARNVVLQMVRYQPAV